MPHSGRAGLRYGRDNAALSVEHQRLVRMAAESLEEWTLQTKCKINHKLI